MRKIDIIGHVYGRWTVLEEVERGKSSRRFLCKCECGTIKEVPMTSLRNGDSQSCGCLRKERLAEQPKLDLSNKKFGRLTALYPLKKRINGKIVWKCICDCGNKVDVTSIYLRNGDTKSCGCIKKEQENKNLRDAYDSKYVESVNTSLLKSKIRTDNKSGVKGVSFNERTGKWDAYIGYNKKQIHLGSYSDKENAINSRKSAEHKYHKPFLDANKTNK